MLAQRYDVNAIDYVHMDVGKLILGRKEGIKRSVCWLEFSIVCSAFCWVRGHFLRDRSHVKLVKASSSFQQPFQAFDNFFIDR